MASGAAAGAGKTQMAPAAVVAARLPDAPLRWSVADGKTARAAVLIAADTYVSDRRWALPSSATSAEVIRDMLVGACGFAREAVVILRGQDVSADRVEAAIAEAGSRLRGTGDRVLWVYFCGHGWVEAGEQQVFTYLTRAGGDTDVAYKPTIGRSDLVRWMAEARAQAGDGCDGVLVIDACRRNKGDPPPRAKLVRSDVWEVYGASEGQFAAAGNQGESFAFTRALADAARALAELGDADLPRVMREAISRTRAISPDQDPELREPIKTATVPNLVVRKRVRFSVRVVDAMNDAELAGATVVLDHHQTVPRDGRFGLEAAPGDHELTVSAPRFLTRKEQIVLRPGQDDATVTVPLVPSLVVVRGRVQPAGVVSLRARAEHLRDGFHLAETTSQGDGRFELRLPALQGASLDLVQDAETTYPIALPKEPDQVVAQGGFTGIGIVDVEFTLPAGATPQPEGPASLSALDRSDWNRARAFVGSGSLDHAREASQRLRGNGALEPWFVWLDSRWAEKWLVDGLREGKASGDWSRAEIVARWWHSSPRKIDNRGVVTAKLDELSRERITTDARREYDGANRAYAEGNLDAALAAYRRVLGRLSSHYKDMVRTQIADLESRLYQTHLAAGTKSEIDGDLASALAAYERALLINVRAWDPVRKLLLARPTLKSSIPWLAGGGTGAAKLVEALPMLALEVRDNKDAVDVGSLVTYQVTLTNTGTAPAEAVELSCEIDGRSHYHIDYGSRTPSRRSGNRVQCAPFAKLAPGSKLEWSVAVRAMQAGESELRVTARWANGSRTVSEREATHFVALP